MSKAIEDEVERVGRMHELLRMLREAEGAPDPRRGPTDGPARPLAGAGRRT
jgi:hypothetical protein